MRKTNQLIGLTLLCALATACKSGIYSGGFLSLEDDAPAEPIPVEAYIDAGIVRFKGPIDEDDLAEGKVFKKVREAETHYFPQQLRQAMIRSGGWRHVWVVPETSVVDLKVEGLIITSDGEDLDLRIIATDATGRRWLDKTYDHELTEENFAPSQGVQMPDMLFDQIAADLLKLRDRQGVEALKEIRTVAELKFARNFAPEAFERYVGRDGGRDYLVSLPAQDDLKYQLVLQIREYDDRFMEQLQAHSMKFSDRIDSSYRDWLKQSYFEHRARSEEVTDSVVQGVLSVLALAAGVAIAADGGHPDTRNAGVLLAAAGAYGAYEAYGKYEGTEIHDAALKELGHSLNLEVEPQIIEIESETYTLRGSVEEQYQQWRDILNDIYASERGLRN